MESSTPHAAATLAPTKCSRSSRCPKPSARKARTPPMDPSPMIDVLNALLKDSKQPSATANELKSSLDKLMEMREAQLRSTWRHKESAEAKDHHPSLVVSPSSATTIMAPTRSSSSNHKSNHVVSSPSATPQWHPRFYMKTFYATSVMTKVTIHAHAPPTYVASAKSKVIHFGCAP